MKTLFQALYALTTITLIPAILGRGIRVGGRSTYFGGGGIEHLPDGKYSCSADTSTAAVPTWATNPLWAASMSYCLDNLSGDTWSGYECIPKDANGNQLGPSFGFWKGETHHSSGSDASSCFTTCQSCLQESISNGQAVKTFCEYEHYVAEGPAVDWTCTMGYDWGTMPTNTTSKLRVVRGLSGTRTSAGHG